MTIQDEELQQYVKKNQKFLKLADGESFSGTYRGKAFIKDPFDKTGEEESIEYTFETDEGREITWTNKTPKVASKFMKIKQGQRFSIKRSGEGPKTNYDIQEIS